jgi:hypothetical protein
MRTSVKSDFFTLSKISANGSSESVSFLKEKYFLRTDSKFVLELKSFIGAKILFQTHIPHLSHNPVVFLSQIRGWIFGIVFFRIGQTAAIQAASEVEIFGRFSEIIFEAASIPKTPCPISMEFRYLSRIMSLFQTFSMMKVNCFQSFSDPASALPKKIFFAVC